MRRLLAWCVPDKALSWRTLAGRHPAACPRCAQRMWHSTGPDEPAGRICATCGWERYVDPFTGYLVDGWPQPDWPQRTYRFDQPAAVQLATKIPAPTVEEVRAAEWPDLTPHMSRESLRGFRREPDA